MRPEGHVRVAAAQFGAGADVTANLATCLRMLERARSERPDLVVLPEFVNHLSWYESPGHCYEVSVELDGPFLAAIAEWARANHTHVVLNCTVRRDGGVATGTSLLYGADGALLAQSDKQVLMGHENDFLRPAQHNGPVVETAVGRLGLYACMDGVIAETPRGLAVRGAQILCNSLNSFAPDEGSLHVPVRAPENRCFVVAANKVGPLIPEALLEPVSQQTGIPVGFLCGAGESQIVAPDGTVLAIADKHSEMVIAADIAPSRADDKRRPDGTDVFASRRPSLYAPIASAPKPRPEGQGALELRVATYVPRADGEDAIADVIGAIAVARREQTELVVLPELFCFEGAKVNDAERARERSERALDALIEACRGGMTYVATSLVCDGAHQGVLVGPTGVALRQAQLHRCARHPWAILGDSVDLAQLPFGRLGLIVGDDHLYPETARLLAIEGANLLAIPFHALERWEVTTGLRERAAENRVCVVAASRATDAGHSFIGDLHADFTLMTPWKRRPFDGCITEPIATYATDRSGFMYATLHPRHSDNKFVSHRTSVIDSRPWALAAPIAS